MSDHSPVNTDFDAKAATWDDDPAKRERAEAVADVIRAAVPLDSSMRLLEYGAGTGLVTQALRETVGPVTLADTSAGMREVLQSKIDAGALTDACIWDVDLAIEDVPAESFDLIVTVMTLHHIDDLATVLAGFAAMLDADGHLCIVDLEEEDGSFHGEGFHGHRGFARAALADDLAAAGFTDIGFADCHHVVRDGVRYGLFLATSSHSDAATAS